MKKVIIYLLVIIFSIFPFLCPAFAGEKEEMLLKQELLKERMMRLQSEFQILQFRIPELQKLQNEFQTTQKELSDLEEKLKKEK